MNVFKENENYSWRKIMTGIVSVVFATACIGYLITHSFDELPGSYQGIIGGVFLFYFAKNAVRNVKFGTGG